MNYFYQSIVSDITALAKDKAYTHMNLNEMTIHQVKLSFVCIVGVVVGRSFVQFKMGKFSHILSLIQFSMCARCNLLVIKTGTDIGARFILSL